MISSGFNICIHRYQLSELINGKNGQPDSLKWLSTMIYNDIADAKWIDGVPTAINKPKYGSGVKTYKLETPLSGDSELSIPNLIKVNRMAIISMKGEPAKDGNENPIVHKLQVSANKAVDFPMYHYTNFVLKERPVMQLLQVPKVARDESYGDYYYGDYGDYEVYDELKDLELSYYKKGFEKGYKMAKRKQLEYKQKRLLRN